MGCLRLDFSRRGVGPFQCSICATHGRFPHFKSRQKTWVCYEKSVLWVKLNNTQKMKIWTRSVRPAGWSVRRLELQYNVIIWFCNPKVSSLAPVQRCCALNRLEIEETTRIWPQHSLISHPTSHSQTRPWHRYSAIFKITSRTNNKCCSCTVRECYF